MTTRQCIAKLVGLVVFQIWGFNLYFHFTEWGQGSPSSLFTTTMMLHEPYSSFDRTAKNSHTKATIGYAISITACINNREVRMLDGAAVLGHSIHLSSIQTPRSGSLYDYLLYAFVHPDAIACAQPLANLGYYVQILQAPINVSDIQNDFFRDKVESTGCCGEKEFLKLYSYTLEQHPVVVHMDVDAIVLRPLDDLFDAMLEGPGSQARSRLSVMYRNDSLPRKIDAFFTRDYNMAPRKDPQKVGVQGGFLVIRPNRAHFDEYIKVILEGNYQPHRGWGNEGYGIYFGSAQIQGLCSYFYGHLHQGTAVELNKCRYNNMADEPSKVKSCRDSQIACDDCRVTELDRIVTAHFTLCEKPWRCFGWHSKSDIQARLCLELHREWFRTRKSLEDSWATAYGSDTVAVHPESSFHIDINFGYCSRGGYRGYAPVQIPSGPS